MFFQYPTRCLWTLATGLLLAGLLAACEIEPVSEADSAARAEEAAAEALRAAERADSAAARADSAAARADSIVALFADPPPGEEEPARAAPTEEATTRVNPARLIIPVAGIKPDALVDTYKAARSGGRDHHAIDIIASRGTRVLAAADGRIVKLFRSEKGGITLYQLAPDNKTVYYYAHLDRYAEGLAEGDAVKQGQVIAYVGDTGNAQPGNHHLHFAVWLTDDPSHYWDGVHVNPYPLLRKPK